MIKCPAGAFAVVALLSLFGCGGSNAKRQAVIDVPEAGLTMLAPSGWRVHGGDAALICYRGYSTGILVIEPLEGREFSEYARSLASEFGGEVVETTSLTINGYDAVRALVEHPGQGVKSLGIYIHRGEKLINISFAVSAADFPEYESSLSDSLASIRFR